MWREEQQADEKANMEYIAAEMNDRCFPQLLGCWKRTGQDGFDSLGCGIAFRWREIRFTAEEQNLQEAYQYACNEDCSPSAEKPCALVPPSGSRVPVIRPSSS